MIIVLNKQIEPGDKERIVGYLKGVPGSRDSGRIGHRFGRRRIGGGRPQPDSGAAGRGGGYSDFQTVQVGVP